MINLGLNWGSYCTLLVVKENPSTMLEIKCKQNKSHIHRFHSTHHVQDVGRIPGHTVSWHSQPCPQSSNIPHTHLSRLAPDPRPCTAVLHTHKAHSNTLDNTCLDLEQDLCNWLLDKGQIFSDKLLNHPEMRIGKHDFQHNMILNTNKIATGQ